jgi:hypothetical protein
MLVVRIIAFQAEYEGSIPFTRSNVFNDFSPRQFPIRTNEAGAPRPWFSCLPTFWRRCLPLIFAVVAGPA